MQVTAVWPLVQKDPTSTEQLGPRHNYGASALEPMSHNSGPKAAATEAQCLEPVLRGKRSHRKQPAHCNGQWLPWTKSEKAHVAPKPTTAKSKTE